MEWKWTEYRKKAQLDKNRDRAEKQEKKQKGLERVSKPWKATGELNSTVNVAAHINSSRKAGSPPVTLTKEDAQLPLSVTATNSNNRIWMTQLGIPTPPMSHININPIQQNSCLPQTY